MVRLFGGIRVLITGAYVCRVRFASRAWLYLISDCVTRSPQAIFSVRLRKVVSLLPARLVAPAKSRGFGRHCCSLRTVLLNATPARIGPRLEASFLFHLPALARVSGESILRVLVVSCLAFNHEAPRVAKRLRLRLRSQARKRSVMDENEDFSQRRLGHIGANDKRVVEEATH